MAAPTKLRGLVGADDAWTFVMFMVQWNDETVTDEMNNSGGRYGTFKPRPCVRVCVRYTISAQTRELL